MEDQNYILFESYLSNELSVDEVTTFELGLKTEPEFNQAFKTYKKLASFLEHKFENEDASNAFQNDLQKISNDHFNKKETVLESKKPAKTVQLYKYAIAACVVALFGIFTLNQFSNPSFNDYNNYDSISLTVRGEQDELLKTAENTFNNKDFAKAEEAFKSLIATDNNNAELKLYRAVANIELDNFEMAESLLTKIKEGNSAYKNKATWYLALSKLKQKKHKACLEFLKRIPEDADDYEQAQKLINKLD